MPEMTGLEFLEEAMDLFPHARRALLTAYADTDAAIEAINIVDLDHYLLKPWDPPEEKLYPVVDALIEMWRSTDEQPVNRIQVVGHRWSARSFEVRDFLARNSVPYRWLSTEEPEGQRLLAAAGVEVTSIPLVVTAEGDYLIEPSMGELAEKVGLSTVPTTDFYDVVIVGGGPAGLGAAVYAASEGLRTVLVERQATGGQAGQSSRIENYLGFPDGVTGTQLTDRARRQAHKFGAEILTTRDVVGLDVRASSRAVWVAAGGAARPGRAADVVLPRPPDRRDAQHRSAPHDRGERNARRRAPRGAHAVQQPGRDPGDGPRRLPLRVHRRRTADGVARRSGGA